MPVSNAPQAAPAVSVVGLEKRYGMRQVLRGIDLAVGSPSLLAAYGGFWILGFSLYALIYAAAGSLVSRAEDLQIVALPLSIPAIAGYLPAVLALSGGSSSIIRIASAFSSLMKRSRSGSEYAHRTSLPSWSRNSGGWPM